MNIRLLFLTIATLVVLLFAGNYAIVRSDLFTETNCDRPLDYCECRVKLSTEQQLTGVKDPSCSVDDKLNAVLEDCRILKVGKKRSLVRCNKSRVAVIICGPSKTRHTVSGGKSLGLNCDDSKTTSVQTSHEAGDWVESTGKDNTKKAGSIWNKITRFAGAEDEIRHTMVAETERITVIDGDAGFIMDGDRPLVSLTAGEAIVESFCDGSITRFKAPAVIRMPNMTGNYDPFSDLPYTAPAPCAPEDLSGRWHGSYLRKYPDLSTEEVAVTIDLRQTPGTLETADGIFDITQFSTSSDRLTLNAKARTGSGRLEFRGGFDKGSLYFDYTEQDVGKPANSLRFGSGLAQRLYIAQWAVSAAAVNTPYRHALLALSPAAGALVWSVSGGSLPEGLSLDGATGVLSGAAAAEGVHEFTVEVRDSNGDSFRQPLSLVVSNLVLATPLLPEAFPGQEYRFKLEMTGGTPPYTWTNEFQFPFPIPGLPPMPQISREGEITFTPEEDDGQLFLTVSDARGTVRQFILFINIRGLTVPDSEFLPAAVVGQPFSYKITAAGQSGTVAWKDLSKSLEGTGLSLNEETGELSGTPAEVGLFTLHVSAEDDQGTVNRDFLLTVDPPS